VKQFIAQLGEVGENEDRRTLDEELIAPYNPKKGNSIKPSLYRGDKQRSVLMTPEQKNMMIVFKDQFNFTGSELELNRQGRLSDRQIELNRRSWWSERGFFALYAIGGVALVGIGWLVSSVSFAGVLCLVIPGVFFLGLSLLTLVLQFRERQHLSENAVKVVEGIVERRVLGHTITGQATLTRSYYFIVADTRIKVPRAAYKALIPDQSYRLYFAKRGSSRLMSIEPSPPRSPLSPESFDLVE